MLVESLRFRFRDRGTLVWEGCRLSRVHVNPNFRSRTRPGLFSVDHLKDAEIQVPNANNRYDVAHGSGTSTKTRRFAKRDLSRIPSIKSFRQLRTVRMRPSLMTVSASAASVGLQFPLAAIAVDVPPPPQPEPIVVTRLPLPPVAPNATQGSCTPFVNPRGTGCIAKTSDLQSGNFLPDGNHVVAIANFTGAPVAPDPAHIYDGKQVIIIKADNTTFSNGDTWKCITCGVPDDNSVGRGDELDYPQSFLDGKRMLAGHNIIECDEEFASDDCTPDITRITPIHWQTTEDDSGPGGAMRELRTSNDNVHIGWSSFQFDGGRLNQHSYVGRLSYNPSPTTGEPLAPRYDVVDAFLLYDPNDYSPFVVNPDKPGELLFKPEAKVVGELRGFSGTGKEVTYIGPAVESSNIDVFAVGLYDGKVRRLTAHPDYVDPVDISPDDKWHVVLDTRGTDRQMFLSGLRGIPPITDIVTTAAVSSTRNNGPRRFFLPWLIDHYGDREDYFGQQINAEGSGVPGSGAINDPEWNGRADPKWSFDGTKIVYTQALTLSPSCGGANPLPCYPSTEEGGRTERVMLAHLTSRDPLPLPVVEPLPDVYPWATPFSPGSKAPSREWVPPGNYTLKGLHSGYASASLKVEGDQGLINSVSVVYHDYSDDGENILNGWERVASRNPTPTVEYVDWYSNLTQTGPNNGTKVTSPDGFHLEIDVLVNILNANGTLTTTVNGNEYKQPANGT